MGGGTPHRKSVYREGGTPHIFSEQGANRGGGHRTYFFEGVTIGFWENHILGGWGHRTYFVNGVGTPHTIERTRFSALLRIQDGFPTDAVGGWVVGSAALYSHFVAPSCKLELARFSA